MALFEKKESHRQIEDHRPIVWREVRGQYAPLIAGAFLTSTPYGNVERNVGYVVMLSYNDLATMDYLYRLYAQTILDMIEESNYYGTRLRVNYTEAMLWDNLGGKPIIIPGNWAQLFKG